MIRCTPIKLFYLYSAKTQTEARNCSYEFKNLQFSTYSILHSSNAFNFKKSIKQNLPPALQLNLFLTKAKAVTNTAKCLFKLPNPHLVTKITNCNIRFSLNHVTLDFVSWHSSITISPAIGVVITSFYVRTRHFQKISIDRLVVLGRVRKHNGPIQKSSNIN